MKCPFCQNINNKVIDSRLCRDGHEIRRRRECLFCKRRFTSYERIEEIPLMIIKKDGRRELFSQEKMGSGLKKACEKRNISMDTIETLINEVERELREIGRKEISSKVIGEKLMLRLHDLDDVAYVRFASVYREFKDVNDFISELESFPKR
jgi:transcriptional repressor NrdR